MTPVGKIDVKKRVALLRKSMQETGGDVVVVAPSANMDWLIGFHPIATERFCLLVITPTKEAIVLPSLDVEAVRALTSISLFAYGDAESPNGALESALAAASAKAARKVVFDETMRADHVLAVIDALPKAQRSVTTETIGTLRMRKGAEEIASLKAIAAINDRAMEAAFAAVRVGRSELDIEAASKIVLPAMPQSLAIG